MIFFFKKKSNLFSSISFTYLLYQKRCVLTEINVVQPCNPAVGGPAKSQLVHEVDALGGEIGKIADR